MKSDENREMERKRGTKRERAWEEDKREKDGEQVRGARAQGSVAVCVNDHYVGECVVCLWSETNK